MRVELRTDDAALAALAPAWTALHCRSRTATLYNTPQWAQVWWRHFGEPGTLRLFLVRDENDALIGLAPMCLTTDGDGEPVLRYLGGVDVSDYLDALAAAGDEEAVASGLLAGWADGRCRGSRQIDLRAVPHASPLREAFLRLAPAAGFKLQVERDEVCPVVTLPDTWDAYLAQLDGKQRRELRRKVRKAGRDVLVSWYQVRAGPPSGLDEAMETFFDLHARSDPTKAAFMTPRMRAFFRDVAHIAAREGWLALSVLLVNGQPAATYFTFDYDNQILLYNSGHDPTLVPEMSPGWVLLAYGIEHAINLGRRRFDFLRGQEDYKFRFGGQAEPVWRLQLEWPGG
ncbi:MAG: GNAT family N-acetyltransferase [Ardenticatenaceae bacterium]|nr:GNAT family N-acetyltransferase [Ardenticatenaceae bacterium]